MKNTMMVMIPEDEWSQIRLAQQEILEVIKGLGNKREEPVRIKYITAMEFMAAVRIRRTKFDQLVSGNKIRIIKKGRKIYVPVPLNPIKHQKNLTSIEFGEVLNLFYPG